MRQTTRKAFSTDLQLPKTTSHHVAYWYQAEPRAPFPALPPRDALELK
jgi:hypothetical protein